MESSPDRRAKSTELVPGNSLASTLLLAFLATLRKNRELAEALIRLAYHQQPLTLRALLYLAVSAGIFPSTDKKYYRQLGRLMTLLRENGLPRHWIVDNLRQTFKPNSWSGLSDFGDVVQRVYRKNCWAPMPTYPCVFIEKDATAATIEKVTSEFDIALHVCRGYASISFVGAIADTWRRINKEVHAYYLGDFDASGFDIERDLREKLERYSSRYIVAPGDDFEKELNPCDIIRWQRLGVVAADFAEFDLIPLDVKHQDARARKFVQEHGHDCAELDALPPVELRRRVREAIESHIDSDEWERLKRVEQAERESLKQFTSAWSESA